jgi:histidine triad (HIT) family protein
MGERYTLTQAERDRRTVEAFADPQVGDRFHEMLSVWWYVVAVEPQGRVALLRGVPPCTLPRDGKLEVYPSHDAYRRHFGYDTIPGHWVNLADRGSDVGGWFEGWPEPPTEPEPCVFCEIVAERAPAVFVRRWTDAVAIVPLEPVVDGHVLVLPRVHVPDATDHPETTALVMRRAASLAVPPCNLITSAGREATQSVFHLHVHIVPRRENDGLALPWYSGRSRRGGGSDG